jgi:hypothetical protein
MNSPSAGDQFTYETQIRKFWNHYNTHLKTLTECHTLCDMLRKSSTITNPDATQNVPKSPNAENGVPSTVLKELKALVTLPL